MLKEEAKAEAVRRFLALPRGERSTETQAAEFAMILSRELRFRASGDPYQQIKGWLLNALDRA